MAEVRIYPHRNIRFPVAVLGILCLLGADGARALPSYQTLSESPVVYPLEDLSLTDEQGRRIHEARPEPTEDRSGGSDQSAVEARGELWAAIAADPSLSAILGHPYSIDGDYGTLVVPVVGLDPSTQARIRAIGEEHDFGIAVHPVPSFLSAEELREMKRDVEFALSPTLSRAWSVGIDGEAGALAISVSEDEYERTYSIVQGLENEWNDRYSLDRRNLELRSAVSEQLPLDLDQRALRHLQTDAQGELVEQSPVNIGVGSIRLSNRAVPPAYGGKWIKHGTTGGVCTIGIVLINPANNPRLSTAGHCRTGSQGRGIVQGKFFAATSSGSRGVAYGNVLRNRFKHESTADVAAFHIADIATNPKTHPRIATSASTFRTVKTVTVTSNQMIWDRYCFNGWAMNHHQNLPKKCGELRNLDTDLWISPVGATSFVVRGFNCITALPIEGDSGAAVYAELSSGAAAVGIMSSEVLFGFWPFQTRRGCYSPIESALDELGSGWLVALG